MNGSTQAPAPTLLHAVLLEPARAAALDATGWDLLVRQARAANLLAELAGRLGSGVPEAPQRHMQAALRIAERQRSGVLWELDNLARALREASGQVVVLKGAAYVALDLPFARRRMFGDVDILVPGRDLGPVESALLVHGWHFDEMDPYEELYYRRWMHELPPLMHRLRGTALDVHHTLLPRTARAPLNAAALFEQLVPLPQWPGLHVLPPAAMLLHSALHLFHEGEFGNGMRDLFDLDALIRHFGTDPAFWPAVADRAAAIGVTRPLHYALTLTTRMLGTPVPAAARESATAAARPGPGAALTTALLEQALVPVHSSCETPRRSLAWFALYLRSHWLRMPLPRLALHLGRKAWWRLTGRAAREAERRQRVEAPP